MLNPPASSTEVLIVAAGRGFRAGNGGPKQYRLLGGMTVLRHTLLAFLAQPRIDRVRVVIHPDDLQAYTEAVAGLALGPVVMGGATRQQSVRAGLEAIDSEGGAGLVLIHDAARPFIPAEMIERILDGLDMNAAVTPALPVVDSLRRAGTDRIIAETIDRNQLFAVQTPQGFDFQSILAAHRATNSDATPDAPPDERLGATDDAAIAYAAGIAVAIVAGDPRAFKLTVAEDFERAHALLASSEMSSHSAAMISRSAMGFDVHRFGEGDHLWLCGLKIAHPQGLIGHSDADVGLHALTDALLGTICAGDIGLHFPPSDPKWRGASSDQFLLHARDLIRTEGGIIDHVDLTLIAEAPKITPHREAMRARIAHLLEIPISVVSVKATTTERLGFTGRGEGIAAQAIATVRIPATMMRS